MLLLLYIYTSNVVVRNDYLLHLLAPKDSRQKCYFFLFLIEHKWFLKTNICAILSSLILWSHRALTCSCRVRISYLSIFIFLKVFFYVSASDFHINTISLFIFHLKAVFAYIFNKSCIFWQFSTFVCCTLRLFFVHVQIIYLYNFYNMMKTVFLYIITLFSQILLR